MRTVDTLIGVLWVVFWLGWLAASVNTKAAAQTRRSSVLGIRVAILIVVVVLVRARVLRGHAATIDDPWLEGVGFTLFILGLAGAIWARVYLGRNWGSPMSEKVDPELVTTGPYRNVRHPIYSGIILATVGTAVAVSPYVLIATLVLGGYFVYSATVEERIMARRFPETYPGYKRSTKMLIPFVF